MAKTKVFYLRKKGTNLVYIRTALLAKRDDMEACDEPTAEKLIAKQTDEAAVLRNQKAAVEAGEAAEDNDGAGEEATTTNVPLSKRKIAELREMATDMKLPFPDEATKADLIALIEEAQAADVASEEDKE